MHQIKAVRCLTSYNYFGLEISLSQPSDSLGKLSEVPGRVWSSAFMYLECSSRPKDTACSFVNDESYLGESALICQIPSMNQHVPLGKLQFMIMGIRNADKSRPPNPGRLGSLIM